MRQITLIVTFLLSVTLSAQAPPSASETRPSFAEWLGGVRQEALARGIRPEVVDQALGEVKEPLPVVIERDRTQAETVLPLETYISQRLTDMLVYRDVHKS